MFMGRACCLWLSGAEVSLDKVVPGPLHRGHPYGVGGAGVSMSQGFPLCFVLELPWCDGWSWSRHGGLLGYSALIPPCRTVRAQAGIVQAPLGTLSWQNC